MTDTIVERESHKPKGILLWGAVAVLLVVGLMLPPFSLADRVLRSGYTKLTQDDLLSHEDGITVALRDSGGEPVWMQLESHQADPDSGSAKVKGAVSSIPGNLQSQGQLFEVISSGDQYPALSIALDVPEGTDLPVDMFGWDGVQWRWIPGTPSADGSQITGEPNFTPLMVALFSARDGRLIVAMELDSDQSPPSELVSLISESYSVSTLNPDLTLGDFSSGVSSQIASFVTLEVNQQISDQLWQDSNAKETLLDNIAAALDGSDQAGANLRFAGLTEVNKQALVDFVSLAATKLHSKGMQLAVSVPTDNSAQSTSSAYDIGVLAESADRLILELPLEPESYADGGASDNIINSASTLVDRRQLMISVVASTVLRNQDGLSLLDDDDTQQVLAESITRTDGGEEQVLPGDAVNVGLADGSFVVNDQSGIVSLTKENDTYYLPTLASITRQLALASKHNLGGLLLNGSTTLVNAADLASTISTIFTSDEIPAASPQLSIAWLVENSDSMLVESSPGDSSNVSYSWIAPDETGEFQIRGELALDNQIASLGALNVSVAKHTPTPEPTATSTSTPVTVAEEPTATPTPTPEQIGDEDGVVDGSIVNIREGPGTVFSQLFFVYEGDKLKFLAVNPDQTWIKIQTADGQVGWIIAEYVIVYSDLNSFPIEDVPTPTPAPTPTATPTPEPGAEPTAAPPPPPPPPAPVIGGGFELGGHIRTWDYLNYVNSAGMTWVKFQIHYPQDGSGLINLAHANGYKIQLSALGPKDMVHWPNFHADYGQWVAGLAAAGADAIEVWNEPNIENDWPVGFINPQSYTNLLCSSYNYIKNANSNVAVISAAMAPTGAFGGCHAHGCDDVPFLQNMYNMGAASCMDYLGAHHNAGATAPSATSGHPADNGGGHHSWYFLPQTQIYFNIFNGTRKLFYTELGYASQEGVEYFSDWFGWARGITNANQAAWLAEAASLGANTGMVRCIIVWNIDFVRHGIDPQDGYAIRRPDGSCPACGTLAAVMGR